jgi:hypothetical protein
MRRSIAQTAFFSPAKYYLEHILGSWFDACAVQRLEIPQHSENNNERKRESASVRD